MKRLRSLLVLIKPGLPDPLYLSLIDRLRTVARGLASARDAAALLDAIDKFAKTEGEGEATPIPALRAWLQESHDVVGVQSDLAKRRRRSQRRSRK